MSNWSVFVFAHKILRWNMKIWGFAELVLLWKSCRRAGGMGGCEGEGGGLGGGESGAGAGPTVATHH